MGLTPADVVDYLHGEGALESPNLSPWPSAAADADVQRVEWNALLPSRRPLLDGAAWDLFGDNWEPDLSQGFLDAVEAQAGRGEGALDHEAKERRPDVCAWYQPIHFHGLDWGIYIREDCLLAIAADIGAFLPTSVAATYTLGKALLRAAFATLFLHEAYHHKTESLGIRLHVVESAGCYTAYFRQVYDVLRKAGSDDLYEEALANADSFNRLGEAAHSRWLSAPVLDATYEYLRWRFPLDPPGYRRAPNYLSEATFDPCEYVLKSQVQEKTSKPRRSVSEWQLAPRVNQSLFTCRSDIWTIVAPGASPVLPTSPPYPSVSTNELTRALARNGYHRVKGGKGSHVKLVATGSPTIILPGDRKDLSPVVVRNVAKTLGYRNAKDMAAGLGL